MKKKPLGVYIHIPFCQSKCAYCDFLSGPSSEENKHQYVEALLQQINVYASLADTYQVRTIFIGGGTPSCIDPQDIKRILTLLDDIFAWRNKEIMEQAPLNHEDSSKTMPVEVTMEANPGTLTKEKLLIYKEAGINRISMGVQSTKDEELRLLGRIHTFEQFEENYRLARECGFTNINVDLMSALPGQTVLSWEQTLSTVIALQPEHISAYSLIIEEGTPFYDRYCSGEGLPTEEEDRQMYHITKRLLQDAGYERYEISNYAKPGLESKHNSSYWERIDYIGFGLGASSCIQDTRFHMTDVLSQYLEEGARTQAAIVQATRIQVSRIQTILKEQTLDNPVDKLDYFRKVDVQPLTTKEQMEETMFLGLRMMRGVNVEAFEQQFQVDFQTIYGKVTKELMKDGLVEEKTGWIRLTERGIDLSNYVMSEYLL